MNYKLGKEERDGVFHDVLNTFLGEIWHCGAKEIEFKEDEDGNE